MRCMSDSNSGFNQARSSDDAPALIGVPVKTHAAQASHAAQQAVAGELFIDPQDPLLEPHGVHVGRDESHVSADGPDIGDMVIDPLQFQANGAERPGTGGNRHAGGAFDGVAESGGVGKARIARDALGQPHAMVQRQVFEELLRALVDVKHPQLQVKHRFAGHAEEEMPGLDDARMDRPDRHLEHAFAFHGAELVSLALEMGQHGFQVKILAQGINLGPIVVQGAAAGIGMADQLQAEPILDLAFLPIHGGNGAGE